MNIDVTIERIDNGYIVTGNDSTKNKHYYDSLEKFAYSRILEDMREKDKEIREHELPDEPFAFKLITNL